MIFLDADAALEQHEPRYLQHWEAGGLCCYRPCYFPTVPFLTRIADSVTEPWLSWIGLFHKEDVLFSTCLIPGVKV